LKLFIQKNLKYLLNTKNLKSNWGQIILLLIPIILTIPPLLKFISERWYLIISVLVIFIVGWLHVINNLADQQALKDEKNTLSADKEHLINTLESVPEKVIKSVFNYLNFSYTERITIYRFNETCFVPVGRYSLNIDFKKYGRREYSKDQGFIGKTWKNGAIHINALPDPDKSKKGYLNKVMAECNIEQRTVEALSMKSRTYYCRNLLSNEEPVAVIVFESIEASLPALIEDIEKLLEGALGQLLVNVIRTNLPLGRE
jgi:hypothetical protein